MYRTGAAIAVEDGVALTRSVSHMDSIEQLQEALDIFEMVRIERAGQMQEASLLNGQLWHFAMDPCKRCETPRWHRKWRGSHSVIAQTSGATLPPRCGVTAMIPRRKLTQPGQRPGRGKSAPSSSGLSVCIYVREMK